MAPLTIREARDDDAGGLWRVLEPVVRDGVTYPVEPDASREAILAYWFAPGKNGVRGRVRGRDRRYLLPQAQFHGPRRPCR